MPDEVTLRATRDIPGIKARLLDSGYKTRRLKAGDEFIVSPVMGRLLVNGLKKAEYYRPPGSVPAPSEAVLSAAKAATPTRRYQSQLDHDRNGENGGSTSAIDEVRALRVEYEQALGKRPFSGWDAATLRAKIAAAK